MNTNKTAIATTAWSERLLPWRKAAIAVLPVFVATRFSFLVLTYLGGVLFNVTDYSSTIIPVTNLLTSWNHFDAVRFAIVATRGYTSLEYAAYFRLSSTFDSFLMPLTLQNP